MIQLWELHRLSPEQLLKIMRRAEIDIGSLLPLAQEVIDQVRTRGDTAVVEYSRKFDAPDFNANMLRVTQADFDDAQLSLIRK